MPKREAPGRVLWVLFFTNNERRGSPFRADQPSEPVSKKFRVEESGEVDIVKIPGSE